MIYWYPILAQPADASLSFPTRWLVAQSIRSWLGVFKDQLTTIILEFLLCQYRLPIKIVTTATSNPHRHSYVNIIDPTVLHTDFQSDQRWRLLNDVSRIEDQMSSRALRSRLAQPSWEKATIDHRPLSGLYEFHGFTLATLKNPPFAADSDRRPASSCTRLLPANWFSN